MSGTLVMKSGQSWYRIHVEFRGNMSYVMPILEKYWSTQEGADRIINTCGGGILMVFERMLAADIDPGSQFASWIERAENAYHNMGTWYNGEQFDHSSNACLSPIVEHMSKMVLSKSNGQTPSRAAALKTKEEAAAKVKNKNVYVWDGDKWSYECANLQATNNPFKRKGNRWGRN